MKDLKRVFLSLDEDNTGKIKLHELQKHMTQFMASTEQPELQIVELFHKVDTNKSNTIEFSEFITAAMEHTLQLSECNLQLAFDTLANDLGLIDAEALKKAFSDTREENSYSSDDEIWEKLMGECDTCSNGVMNYDDFR